MTTLNHNGMTTKIIQLSDFHLLKAADEELRGVPTAACLADVLAFVREKSADADVFIMTGDIAAHGEAAAYELADELCRDLLPRSVMIPGNHDDADLMRRIFPELVPGDTGPVGFSREIGGWRLIGLDTHVAGEVAGKLSREQLVALSKKLSVHAEQPSLIFMHHPPISVGSAWLDRIMLRNAHDLAAVLASAPQVRGIFCGHVHQEYSGMLGKIPVFTAPATAIQFAPGTEELEFDDIPPGFRVIELFGDEFQTQILRLPELKFRATPNS